MLDTVGRRARYKELNHLIKVQSPITKKQTLSVQNCYFMFILPIMFDTNYSDLYRSKV